MDICPGQLVAVKRLKFNESKFSVTQLDRGLMTGEGEGWVGVEGDEVEAVSVGALGLVEVVTGAPEGVATGVAVGLTLGAEDVAGIPKPEGFWHAGGAIGRQDAPLDTKAPLQQTG
jgi:hypothetical protein